MTPTVTVLMPVYNGTRYLREAIDSILSQTYDDFEFLIIDDASTDESASLVRSYADVRIRLVQNEVNKGQVSSQNIGLRLARGMYIARLDQDDSSLPTRLARQVAVLDAEPMVAVVGSWMFELDGADGVTANWWQGRPVDDLAEYLFAILTNALPLYHPSVMFRREAVVQLDGYDEQLPYCEDNDLWRRLALAGYDARVINEPLTRYRVHEGQQSVSNADLQWNNHVFSQERFIRAFVDKSAVPSLRLFMTCGSLLGGGFWDTCSSPGEARALCRRLDRMLGAMRLQLQLQPRQYRKLVRLVRCHAARVAGRAWRRDIRRQWSASRPIYMFSLRGGIPVASSFHTWIYPLVFVLAPIMPALRMLKRWALREVFVERCHSFVRARVRRFRALRYWYSRIY